MTCSKTSPDYTITYYLVEFASIQGRIFCIRNLFNGETLSFRSLKNKTASIVDYVQDCKADIFAITETWLTQNDAVVCGEITPAGYRLLHCPCADRVGVVPHYYIKKVLTDVNSPLVK